jgi:basic membrane lipoprotein Med (substrate-binding protein (PBP1-ABC) superfamily)
MRLRTTGRALTAAALAVAKLASSLAGLTALAALAVLGALAGCARHAATTGTSSTDATSATAGDGSAQGGSFQREAERTKAMEEKARELDKKAAEIQNMQGTEQEKIDAVNKLEQERQELHGMSGDSSTPANPPPQ